MVRTGYYGWGKNYIMRTRMMKQFISHYGTDKINHNWSTYPLNFKSLSNTWKVIRH